VGKTWSPKGQTPTLPSKLTRDHLSVISAISPEGELFLAVRETAFDSDAIIGFLDELHYQMRSPLVVVWDGAAIHRSQKIKHYLAHGAAKWLHLERLPGYAPELNPDEGIWHYLKQVEMKNLCCADQTELRTKLTEATQRVQAKPDIVKACFKQTGYY